MIFVGHMEEQNEPRDGSDEEPEEGALLTPGLLEADEEGCVETFGDPGGEVKDPVDGSDEDVAMGDDIRYELVRGIFSLVEAIVDSLGEALGDELGDEPDRGIFAVGEALGEML